MVPQPVRKLPGENRIYEAWHGGERVLAYVTPDACALLDERGRNRSRTHAEITNALARLAERARTAFVLDCEVTGEGSEARLYVLDILLLGSNGLLAASWRDRRRALEELFAKRRVPGVKPVPTGADGEAMLRRAGKEGWSGVFGRDPASPYRPGKRTAEWVRFATPARYR
jgi:ATP-dependent DNA ligase